MSIAINLEKTRKVFFKKRIPEPKVMERVEHDVFEKASQENYKRWMVPLVDDALERFEKNNKKDNLKILDIACGPGLLTKELGERSAKFSVFGLDNSKYALKLAKKNCRDLLRRKRVFLKLASAYNIPFSNDYFDLVRENAPDLVEEIKLLDKYENIEKFGRDKVSYAFRITYRSLDRTLISSEIDQLHKKIEDATAKTFAAQIR